ncbi:MAG: hypothetical protein Q7J07_07820 [Pelolinea sp.]|nr:hypothetical protein [Pelolinea sp.]
MNLTATQRLTRITSSFFKNIKIQSRSVYMVVIVLALAAFEIFNFSTTDFALQDILGSQGNGLLPWATILSLAFCGMDIAGIANILTCQNEDSKEKSSWYLLGAWALAAAMNTGLTWWGISVVIYNQPAHAVMIVDPMTYVTVIPVIGAVMVWVIRVLIIGSLVSSFDKSLKESSPKKKATRNTSFGFRTDRQAVPAGYTPVPSRASMERDNLAH